MLGSRRLRSPALVLLLLRPLLASGDSASRLQTRAMNPGGGERGSPEDSHRLQRSTVPGSDPQRSNELLLLTSREGDSPEQRHHVLYFPGDVQVTRGQASPTRPHGFSYDGGAGRAPVPARAPSGEGALEGHGLQRAAVSPGATGWKERRDREWDSHAQLQPALRGLCVCWALDCLENAD
jgi:hypothetical protein